MVSLWVYAGERPREELAPVAVDAPQAGRIVIRSGPTTPRVLTEATHFDGTPVTVACSTCHSVREPNLKNGEHHLPATFHPGLKVAHGSLSCLSCHNATDYDTLRKADGTPVAFEATRDLCAQCHGPQTRDYLHGSHGGMQGHWDLSRGDRLRNTCTDCHDPHAPKYPAVRPVFAPIDRGAREQAARETHSQP